MSKVAKVEADLLPIDPMVSMIERVATDPNADISKLERMLEMKERHDAQQAKIAFDKAFAAASAEFPDIPKNGRNTHNGQSYSTLKDILSTVRPVLTQHGFALSFRTETSPEAVTVIADLSHETGHSKQNAIDLPRDKGAGRNEVQAVGSSQTYGQRYTAQALLGLSLGEDTEDDGSSTGKIQEREPKKPYSWAATVTQDLPENASLRDKAEVVAEALCKQFGRMKGVRQIDNEWDRRVSIIDSLEVKHNDLWGNVIQAYEERRHELGDQQETV